MRYPPKTPKTIRQHFNKNNFGTLSFSQSPSPGQRKELRVNHSLAWRTYYVKLLVIARARQWLSAAERLDPIEDAPPTPKTNFELADAIKQPNGAEYAQFGCDFKDNDAYSPVESRLLLYAEIHNCSDHDYGTFSTPKQMMSYTYRRLQ